MKLHFLCGTALLAVLAAHARTDYPVRAADMTNVNRH